MISRLKILFADFFRALRQLWLEVMGGVFLAFGLLFFVTAIREYRKYAKTPGYGMSSLVMAGFFSGLMLWFAVDSFWKSRKSR